MSNYSVQKASDLARDERILVEHWLGRPIGADETISINAWKPHPVPPDSTRETLARDIVAQAVAIGSRAPELSDRESEALIGEALRAIRGSRG